jgi:hypothetical protein
VATQDDDPYVRRLNKLVQTIDRRVALAWLTTLEQLDQLMHQRGEALDTTCGVVEPTKRFCAAVSSGELTRPFDDEQMGLTTYIWPHLVDDHQLVDDLDRVTRVPVVVQASDLVAQALDQLDELNPRGWDDELHGRSRQRQLFSELGERDE